MFWTSFRRHGTQHNDIQHNDTKPGRHIYSINDTTHKRRSAIMLSVMFCFVYLYCTVCCYANCQYAVSICFMLLCWMLFFKVSLWCAVRLKVIIKSVIMVYVIRLNVIITSLIMVYVVMLNVIIKSVILVYVVLLNAIILSVIMLNAVILNVIIPSVMEPSLFSVWRKISSPLQITRKYSPSKFEEDIADRRILLFFRCWSGIWNSRRKF